METQQQIENVYKTSKNYPELVKGLIAIGTLSYTVEVSTGDILYRFAEGHNILHPGKITPRTISETFSSEKTIEAVRASQQGKINYPQFMDAIAQAGVRFYESTLNGSKKRVTYIGFGGQYEELIPL